MLAARLPSDVDSSASLHLSALLSSQPTLLRDAAARVAATRRPLDALRSGVGLSLAVNLARRYGGARIGHDASGRPRVLYDDDTGPHPAGAAADVSISHHGAWVVAAAAPAGARVGVDVLRLDAAPASAVARARLAAYMAPEERAALGTAAPHQMRLFAALWAAKEAVVKARGGAGVSAAAFAALALAPTSLAALMAWVARGDGDDGIELVLCPPLEGEGRLHVWMLDAEHVAALAHCGESEDTGVEPWPPRVEEVRFEDALEGMGASVRGGPFRLKAASSL